MQHTLVQNSCRRMHGLVQALPYAMTCVWRVKRFFFFNGRTPDVSRASLEQNIVPVP
ncbi:MAG: hypothetical protein JGK27_13585 [Microcoleus sp. PH2017_20_SFW_D_A]|nr:hypothetical protein [Microcoleus sp. PH2017_20_SFW_D_A]